jgi:hypothetical protein
MDGDERRRLSEIAAANNAEWCAAVWRSHGLEVERGEGLWFCRSETPRFYPNVVTVDLNADPERQAGFIRELSQGADFEFDVKDSFACLPLAAAGFQPLFSAFWLSRSFQDIQPYGPEPVWRRISEGELQSWETAWAADDPHARGIFRNLLLEDPRVVVIGGVDGQGRVVAGGIAFEAAGVVGLTNVFGSATGLFRALSGLVISSRLVAYEPGATAETSRRRGFQPLGPLKVWSRARRP